MNTSLYTNRLFNDLFDTLSLDSRIHPSEEAYEFNVNLAGFKKENVKVKAEDGLLHISVEQGDRSYSRYFTVPDKADPTATVIKYEEGLLHVKFIKNEKEKGVNIAVN
jgi:HSP20 family molecular chaperone IbpA